MYPTVSFKVYSLSCISYTSKKLLEREKLMARITESQERTLRRKTSGERLRARARQKPGAR